MLQNECEKQVRYGCFLIIPLKYDPATLARDYLEKNASYQPLTTMDLNENIKAMMDRTDESAIGACYQISRDVLVAPLGSSGMPAVPQHFLVSGGQETDFFQISDSWLYVFHTQVAFFCLSLSFPRMEALLAICNPGSAENSASFGWVDASGNAHPFSLEGWLADLLTPFGFAQFFNGPSSFLLDAYAHIFAVVPQRFQTLEEIRQIYRSMH